MSREPFEKEKSSWLKIPSSKKLAQLISLMFLPSCVLLNRSGLTTGKEFLSLSISKQSVEGYETSMFRKLKPIETVLVHRTLSRIEIPKLKSISILMKKGMEYQSHSTLLLE